MRYSSFWLGINNKKIVDRLLGYSSEYSELGPENQAHKMSNRKTQWTDWNQEEQEYLNMLRHNQKN